MKFLLFLLLPFMAQAQVDTIPTPQVQNQINALSAQRNYFYELSQSLQTANKALVISNQTLITANKALTDSLHPVTKLRGLNVHFGKNTYPDYTATKIKPVIDMNRAIHGNAFRCDVTLNGDGSAKYPIFDQFADSCRKYRMKIMVVLSQTSADGAGFVKKYGDVVVAVQLGNELDNLYELTKLDTNKAAKSWVTFMNRFTQQAKGLDFVVNFSWTHYITPNYFKMNVPLINGIGIDNYNDSEQNSIAGVSQLGQALNRAKKISGVKKYGITEIGFLVTKSKGTTQDQFFTKVLPLYQDADYVFIYEALDEPIGRAKSVIDERTLGLTPASVLAISKLKW